jgi:hypothetical protein
MASRPTRRRAGAGARRSSTLPATTTSHAAAAGDRASQPRSGTQIRPAPHLHRPCASVDREEAVAFEPAAAPPWRSVEGPDPDRQLLRHGSLPLLREAAQPFLDGRPRPSGGYRRVWRTGSRRRPFSLLAAAAAAAEHQLPHRPGPRRIFPAPCFQLTAGEASSPTHDAQLLLSSARWRGAPTTGREVGPTRA